jgi:hypothetical protein
LLKRLASIVLLALLVVAAPAAAGQYVLKHPKHEHCRAGYQRKTQTIKRRREIICVRKTPQRAPQQHGPATEQAPALPTPAPSPAPSSTAQALTPTFTFVTAIEGGGILLGVPAYKTISVNVNTQNPGPENGVIGVPVTITLDDYTTGVVLGSFVEPSYSFRCLIVKEVNGGNWVLHGEAIGHEVGCPLEPITAPEDDEIDIKGSFDGNTQYGPSESGWQLFV